jgi:hypothetical protein
MKESKEMKAMKRSNKTSQKGTKYIMHRPPQIPTDDMKIIHSNMKWAGPTHEDTNAISSPLIHLANYSFIHLIHYRIF